MKRVLICLKSIQSVDGTTDSVEFETYGTMTEKNGCTYLYYKENSDIGAQEVNTVLKVKDDIVTIIRTGDLNGRLVFEKGSRHECLYPTIYGNTRIGVFSQTVKNELIKNGSITLCYTLDINGQCISKNRVEINVREEEKNQCQ